MGSRAVFAALAWFFAPFWLFAVVALALYLIPLFQPFSLAAPLLAALVLGAVMEPTIVSAFVIAVLFYFILGIKDLVFIRRVEAYETTVGLLMLAAGSEFFRAFHTFEHQTAAFLAGGLFFALMESLRVYRRRESGTQTETPTARIAPAAVALLLAEWTWVLMLLPLPQMFAALLFFLVAFLLIELTSEYAGGFLRRKNILWMGSAFGTVLVAVLTATTWGL